MKSVLSATTPLKDSGCSNRMTTVSLGTKASMTMIFIFYTMYAKSFRKIPWIFYFWIFWYPTTRSFFLLNRNTLGISHARDWEWVSRFRRSSLWCSRVPFWGKRRHPALHAVTWDDFPRTISQEKWEKTVCFDRLATKLCFKVRCPIFVTFFKHAKHAGIKRCGFCAQQQGRWGILVFDSLS